MNTYDPADGIRYVHLDGQAGTLPEVTPLPAGYADQSPRTSLRNRAGGRRSRRPALPATAG